VCVVVLPIGLSCPVKFVVCHSRDRDTRWAFCCSRGCGCGDVKMADVRGSPRFARGTRQGACLVSPASRGEPGRARVWFPLRAGGTLWRGSSLSLIFANYGVVIGLIPIARAEFTIAPLLKVPPASRGEPCWGLIPRFAKGTAQGVRFPCGQGEPEGGGSQ